MVAKKLFLFVIEGLRENDVFDNLSKVFFDGKGEVVTVPVPAEMNVYMLYKTLKEDDFETDIVEVLKEKVPGANEVLKDYHRDSFAEIYLFFDFDDQANNLRGVDNEIALKEMLEAFDNETELGKLYISYPMVEALRDHVIDSCGVVSGACHRNRKDFGAYKEDSSAKIENNSFKGYDYPKWMGIVRNYVYRTSCLFHKNKLDRNDFIDTVTPFTIFEKQMYAYKKSEDIFILSCLPEFLIDYSEKYWKESVCRRKKPVLNASCQYK